MKYMQKSLNKTLANGFLQYIRILTQNRGVYPGNLRLVQYSKTNQYYLSRKKNHNIPSIEQKKH